MNSIFSGAKWIWLRQDADVVHQYVCFRKKFSGDSLNGGRLYIAADTDFIAYINGLEIGRGQFSDWPKDKTYSVFQLPPLTQQGQNVLCVLGYYCGTEFQTYTPGQAGMIAKLRFGDMEIVTDDSWKCFQSPSFQSGGQPFFDSWKHTTPPSLNPLALPPLTTQLGFVTKYDARNEMDWLSLSFEDSAWQNAQIRNGFWEKLTPRPVAPLRMGERVPTKIVMLGSVLRDRELTTFADTVSADFLRHDVLGEMPTVYPLELMVPEEPANGWFVIADLGAESVGLIDIELEATAGTVVDISHGEHLLDGKVRNKIGNRNFTDRYICKDGFNHYLLPFRRIGGRYIQLNITNTQNAMSIHYIGIRPLYASLPRTSDFRCGDALAERTRMVGIRTLELCMHEHYEDCPWREQALYAYDSRNQILYGYYVWGNYAYAAASLDLLGRGIRSDGFLQMCAPSKRAMTIPIFSFVWITELYEHWLHSGNDELFTKYNQQIEFMVGKVLEQLDPENGLYRLGSDRNLWHFYEWSPELSLINCQEDEYHALYNMYFYETLISYAAMLRFGGRARQADDILAVAAQLKDAINHTFWSVDCYATRLIGGQLQGFHEHVQFLAIYNQLCPPEKLMSLVDTIYSGKLHEVTFSAMPYMLRAMMPLSPVSRKYVSTALYHAFSPMIFEGATSLWETKFGAADFDGAGSLCHAWSSLPVYYYHAWVLGIMPLEPGFKRFSVTPFPDQFGAVHGSVPTPFGFINIELDKTGNGLNITMEGPQGLLPVLTPLEEFPVLHATYNGVEISI